MLRLIIDARRSIYDESIQESVSSNLPFFSLFFLLGIFWSDVYDNVEYLSSLGKAQTANVKRDAAVGVAQANRDAGIRVNTVFQQEISPIMRVNCSTIFRVFPGKKK